MARLGRRLGFARRLERKSEASCAGCGRVDAGLRRGSGEAGPLVGFARAIGVGCWLRRGSGEAGPPLGLCTAFGEKKRGFMRGLWARGRGAKAWKRRGWAVGWLCAGDRRGMLAKAWKRRGWAAAWALHGVWREKARLHARMWARGRGAKAWKRRGWAAGCLCTAFGEKSEASCAGRGRVEAGLRHGNGEAGPLVGFARAVGAWKRG